MKKRYIIIFICIILITIAFLLLFMSGRENNLDIETMQNYTDDSEKQEITQEEQEEILKGNLGEINRIFKDGSITNTSATILLINRTNLCYPYSHWFVIEKKVNNNWKLLKFKKDIVINAIYTCIMPNRCVELKLDWNDVYGNLKKRRI